MDMDAEALLSGLAWRDVGAKLTPPPRMQSVSAITETRVDQWN